MTEPWTDRRRIDEMLADAAHDLSPGQIIDLATMFDRLLKSLDALTARAVRAEEMLTRATAAYEGSTRDLLADKKRLDWLDATHCDVLGAEWSGGRWHQFLLEDEDGTIIGEGATIREAIDKATPRPATP